MNKIYNEYLVNMRNLVSVYLDNYKNKDFDDEYKEANEFLLNYTFGKNRGEKIFFIEEGTVEFSNNSLLILTSTAKNLDSLDKDSINSIIKSSQEKISKYETNDKEKYLLSHKIDTLREIN